VEVRAQVPLTPKQPLVKLIPFAKVEEAVEVFVIEPPVIERPFDEESPAVCTPPAKVEVAVVVATRFPTVSVPFWRK